MTMLCDTGCVHHVWIFLISFIVNHIGVHPVRIVAFPPSAMAASHITLMSRLCEELSKRGYYTTLVLQGIDTFPQQTKYDVAYARSSMIGVDLEDFGKQLINSMFTDGFGLTDMFNVIDKMKQECQELLNDTSLEKRLTKEKYDIAIVDHFHFCGFIYAEKLGIPYIVLDSTGYWSPGDSGVPVPVSYIPVFNSLLSDRMTFLDRVINVVALSGQWLAWKYMLAPFDNLKKQYNIQPTRSLSESMADAEMWLINTDFILEFPRPLMPNMVYVGGLLTKASGPLTKEYTDFIQDAGSDGVVVVSFGSSINIPFPQSVVHKLVQAFKMVKHRVIWRVVQNGTDIKVSDNVLTKPTIPQNDLMGHPNVKLLVSHCGINSVLEAIYHGKPILCIPLYGDQMDNAVRVVTKGIGLRLDALHFNSESLANSIQYLATHPRYKERVAKLSAAYQHRTMSPLDLAVFSIEHVTKYAPPKFYRNRSLDLSVYQYYMIDVTLFLTVIVFSMLFSVCYCCSKAWKRLRKAPVVKAKDD